MTLCSSNIAELVDAWSVDPIFNNSDHKYILIELKFPLTTNQSYRYKSKYCKSSTFNTPIKILLDDKINEIELLQTSEAIDSFIKDLTQQINNICNISFRKRKIFSKTTNLNCLTPQLSSERNKLTAMRRHYHNNPTPESLMVFKRHKVLYKKSLRKARGDS